MKYAEAEKIKAGERIRPKMYNWDFVRTGGVFDKRSGTVSTTEKSVENGKRKITFILEDGRRVPHTEVEGRAAPRCVNPGKEP